VGVLCSFSDMAPLLGATMLSLDNGLIYVLSLAAGMGLLASMAAMFVKEDTKK